jgi:hypothetical protein
MSNRTARSYSMLYKLFQQPKVTRRAVFCLIAVHTCLLVYSAHVHSPTLNEPGHLVAGLSHWKFQAFDLYRVNPPLIRMTASLPVIAAGYKEDWAGFSDAPLMRPEFTIGENFTAINGERSLYLITLARLACIPFSWVGAITCYLWARDLYGRPSGVLACAFWCFEPNILAHAPLITPDLGAAAMGIAAYYTFWRWLKKPTWTQAIVTGGILGLAELCKTTFLLFYPLWPLLWLVYRWPDRSKLFAMDWLCELGMLGLRMVIGLYVLNLGYAFEGTGTTLKEYKFVSELFAGTAREPKSPEASDINDNRFANSWLGTIPLPLPRNYVLGIDLQQHDFEQYPRPFFLGGTWSKEGWWYYYLYAAAIKVPLSFWLLIAVGCLIRFYDGRTVFSPRDEIAVLFPCFAILITVSSKTGINEHLRYALPCLPFLIVWVSALGTLDRVYRPKVIKELAIRSTVTSVVVSVLLAWFVLSSMWIYPHSLSYFNEVVGGPRNGFNHLLHSNIDWGQDLKYFQNWLSNQRDSQSLGSVYLAYFGFFDPSDVGITDVLSWPTIKGQASISDEARASAEIRSGYYVISVNLLKGYPWPSRGGDGHTGIINQRVLQHFANLAPMCQVGYTTFIFHVEK